MKPSTKFVLALLAFGSIILLIHVIRSGARRDAAVEARTALDGATAPVQVPVDPAEEARDRARVEALERQAEYREKAQRAAALTMASRARAVKQIEPAWTTYVRTNQAKYTAIVQKARQDPHGTAHCTICNGVGDIACVMCNNHDGKCITCGGKGSDVGQEFCPTCNGSGKCYLCSGLGRMNCAFCNDGVIATDTPPPPLSAPLH